MLKRVSLWGLTGLLLLAVALLLMRFQGDGPVESAAPEFATSREAEGGISFASSGEEAHIEPEAESRSRNEISVIASAGEGVVWTEKNPAATRARVVEINPELLDVDISGIEVGDMLRVELFDGESVQARIGDRKLWGRDDGTMAITARITDDPNGYITLSSTGGLIRLWVKQPGQGKEYHIRYDVKTDRHILLDVDMPSTETYVCGTCGQVHGYELDSSPLVDSILPDGVGGGASQPLSDPPAYGDTVLGLMIVYTPAALQAKGSLANIQATISEAVNRGNIVLENSETETQLDLVHTAEVDYSENSSASTDLNRIRNVSDGYMDEVHLWRTIYGADFVSLFIDTSSVGGLGFRPSGYDRPDIAFNLVRVQQADTTSYTTIHELGHNMGIGHSKSQSSQAYNGNGIAVYAAGWQWADSSSSASIGYCSVMTYENHNGSGGAEYDRVAHFSNPNVNFNGNSTGDSVDGDAASVIRDGRSFFAAFYEPSEIPVVTFPYSLGFESGEPTWLQSTDDTYEWELGHSGSTPSVDTGPSSANSGSQYAYIEASFNFDETASIEMDFDMSALASPRMIFYYHMKDSGTGIMGDLFLELSTDEGENWSPLFARSGDQGDVWHLAEVDLSTYAGQLVRLRFRGVTGSSFRSDIALDDILIEEFVGNDPPADFAAWIATFGSVSDASQTGDPDGDFVVNFLEYALGRDPTVAETASPFTATYDSVAEEFSFTFVRGQANVRYVVHTTTDVSDWSNPVEEWDSDQSPANLVAVGEEQTVVIPATDPNCFIRLSVSE